jgi:hypothetical protein
MDDFGQTLAEPARRPGKRGKRVSPTRRSRPAWTSSECPASCVAMLILLPVPPAVSPAYNSKPLREHCARTRRNQSGPTRGALTMSLEDSLLQAFLRGSLAVSAVARPPSPGLVAGGSSATAVLTWSWARQRPSSAPRTVAAQLAGPASRAGGIRGIARERLNPAARGQCYPASPF